MHILIATGAHRPNTDDEIRNTFGALAKEIKIQNHNCDKDLVLIGMLGDGIELLVNSEISGAELIITVGAIMPHNLAGFSGGPKLIMPGICGRKTIEHNHRMMTKGGVGPGKILDNPIHNQILEAARLVGVDFTINIVLNHNNEIAGIFSGELETAWREGCKFSESMHRLPLPAQEEVVIAGGGGYPRDLNLYQAVKALVNASKVCKKGGTIVLIARCQEGMGDAIFEEWINCGSVSKVLQHFKEKGFELGGIKLRVVQFTKGLRSNNAFRIAKGQRENPIY
nr:nickel-dependent lactate racemase [Desulforamulus aquiferis]